MPQKRVSISQMALELGVSISTVSRALKGNPVISTEMIEKVQRLAADLNYTPNSHTSNTKRVKRKTIGVIIPLVGRHFFSSAIEGIEDYAYTRGFDVLICQSKNVAEREKQLVYSLSTKVDGVIASLSASYSSHDYFNYFADVGIPLVLFDRIDISIIASTISVDDFYGAKTATEHLINQGYRRIFNYCGPRRIKLWDDRHQGYLAAMAEAGIEIQSDWICEGPTNEIYGQQYAQKLIADDAQLPEAIFFSSDFTALGAMMEFKRQGINIPNDIAIVGFADEPFCKILEPPLTSVNQFSTEMGYTACSMLLDIIEGSPCLNKVIEPELIVRDSSIRLVK